MAEIIPLFKAGHPHRYHGQCQRCPRVDYLPWATERGVRYCGHCWEADALSYADAKGQHPTLSTETTITIAGEKNDRQIQTHLRGRDRV